MSRKLWLWIFLFGFPTIINAETIYYEGSSTVGKFISDANEVYQAAQFKINTIPESAGGEQCAWRRRCDMGGVARAVNPKYLKRGVVATLIGKDAIAVIVNQKNPLNELSKAQLKAIFTGKTTNWSQLGWQDATIQPLIVKKTSATRHVFANAILEGEDYQGVDVVTPDAKIIAEVYRNPYAIGQLSFAFIQNKSGIKPLVIEGETASVDNPDYPITRPLHIATYGPPRGAIKIFLDWALSAEGQKIVKQRFVGVSQ